MLFYFDVHHLEVSREMTSGLFEVGIYGTAPIVFPKRLRRAFSLNARTSPITPRHIPQ